jgi:hypothetical protein
MICSSWDFVIVYGAVTVKGCGLVKIPPAVSMDMV